MACHTTGDSRTKSSVFVQRGTPPPPAAPPRFVPDNPVHFYNAAVPKLLVCDLIVEKVSSHTGKKRFLFVSTKGLQTSLFDFTGTIFAAHVIPHVTFHVDSRLIECVASAAVLHRFVDDPAAQLVLVKRERFARHVPGASVREK